MSIYDAVYHTGNTALDFVLREKALRCQEYEIKFSLSHRRRRPEIYGYSGQVSIEIVDAEILRERYENTEIRTYGESGKEGENE